MPWAKEIIKSKIKKNSELNENENKTYQDI